MNWLLAVTPWSHSFSIIPSSVYWKQYKELSHHSQKAFTLPRPIFCISLINTHYHNPHQLLPYSLSFLIEIDNVNSEKRRKRKGSTQNFALNLLRHQKSPTQWLCLELQCSFSSTFPCSSPSLMLRIHLLSTTLRSLTSLLLLLEFLNRFLSFFFFFFSLCCFLFFLDVGVLTFPHTHFEFLKVSSFTCRSASRDTHE